MTSKASEGLFLGLGFQKCATTQITLRLSRHPAVWPHPVRELRYWDAYFHGRRLPPQTRYLSKLSEKLRNTPPGRPAWSRTARALRAWCRYADCAHDGPEDYLALFDDRPAGARAFGEISPGYAALSAGQIAEIHERLARPRVFVIMRDPVARALSQIRHEARLKPGTLTGPERQAAFLESETVREMSDYPRVIRAMQGLPEPEKVGFFFFEDFVADMEGFLRRLCDFLGVPWHPAVCGDMGPRRRTAAEPALEIAPEARRRAAELYGGVGAEVARLLGRAPEGWRMREAVL